MDKQRWEAAIWKDAQALSKRLRAKLEEPDAQSVTLTRDEAAFAIGILDGVVETLEKGDGNPR
ncbi:hypothetical protein SAMN02927924_01655 [Sphingobium faniae]|nr:hypothetical protein SAMN02927924_01655 [Sphingobium faniae]